MVNTPLMGEDPGNLPFILVKAAFTVLPLAIAVWLAAAETATAQDVSRPIRDVTPSFILPGPEITGPLVRAPVPEPPPPEPAARADAWRRFFLPEATDAGTFVADGLTIRLAGIAPPKLDDTCVADGAPWPCGRASRHNLRLLLHGRAIECRMSPSDSGEVTAPCRVGETDIALWLVRNGWARTAAHAPDELKEAEIAAYCAGAGIWRGLTDPDDCAGA